MEYAQMQYKKIFEKFGWELKENRCLDESNRNVKSVALSFGNLRAMQTSYDQLESVQKTWKQKYCD